MRGVVGGRWGVLLLVGLLAACGGEEAGDVEDPTPPGVEEPAPTEDPSAPADAVPDDEPAEGEDPSADDPGGEPGRPEGAEETAATVRVYFGNSRRTEGEVYPVERVVDAPAVLAGALEELLAGPTASEREDGYTSWFSEATAGMLDGVRIEDGVAHVAFDEALPELIPNASTSAGSAALLAGLDATVTQFPTVERVVYSLEGDVDAFYHWLQLVPPS